jgi:capsular exopolysaccharide synthesis family protein
LSGARTLAVVAGRDGMRAHQPISVLWRWRSLILAGALIGVVVGWVSAPGRRVEPALFAATNSLLVKPENARNADLARDAVRAKLGAVPSRVAARLGIDRKLAQSSVSVSTPPNLGAILITGKSSDPAQAEALANVTAEELLVELGGPEAYLRSLEPAVAAPVGSDEIRPPESRVGRGLFLGAFGLLLGVGAAFAVHRFDKRIRTKTGAEEALGLPVLGVVPTIPRSESGLPLGSSRSSAAVESYRALRTAVDEWAARFGAEGHPLIVVTSPNGGEGATTTVAHLGAAFGEIGRSLLLISADLRRPRLHLYFGRARDPGLSDVLRGAPDTRRLSDLNLVTTTRGVRLVASGAPVPNPSSLLEHLDERLDEARSLGDVVLIDAPPLLTASEATELVSHADGVLVVVRAGRTSVSAAARSSELLARFGVPVIGAVLVDAGPARAQE